MLDLCHTSWDSRRRLSRQPGVYTDLLWLQYRNQLACEGNEADPTKFLCWWQQYFTWEVNHHLLVSTLLPICFFESWADSYLKESMRPRKQSHQQYLVEPSTRTQIHDSLSKTFVKFWVEVGIRILAVSESFKLCHRLLLLSCHWPLVCTLQNIY